MFSNQSNELTEKTKSISKKDEKKTKSISKKDANFKIKVNLKYKQKHFLI